MGSNVTTGASDADRDRIAAALGEHHAAGRLATVLGIDGRPLADTTWPVLSRV